MNKKKIGLLATGVTVGIVAIVAVVFLFLNKEEAYRQIQVYELNGTATVTRENNKTLEAYNNMQLQNNDEVSVPKDSFVQLKLDDDKYALLEGDTEIQLVASGNSQDSKTLIELKKGSIINNLQNKLGESSSYEVNTPNSTMAVRGTTFRMEVSYDKNGTPHTTLEVMEGTVACQLKNPDGTMNEEIVMVTKGNSVQVNGIKGNADYKITNGTVEYRNLDLNALQFLNRILANEKNKSFSIDKSELEKVINEKNAAAMAETQNNNSATIKNKTEGKEDATTKQETKAVINDNIVNVQPDNNNQTTVWVANNDTQAVQEPTTQATVKPTQDETSTSVEKPTSIEKPTQAEIPTEVEKPTQVEQPTKPETPIQPEKPTQPIEPEIPTQPEKPTQPIEPEIPTEPETPTQPEKHVYIVQFVYNNNVFGTSKVIEGEQVGKPVLQPTEKGYWEYDFSVSVNSDLIVNWISEDSEKDDNDSNDYIELPEKPLYVVGIKLPSGNYIGIVTIIAPANYQISTRVINDDGTMGEWTSWASSINMSASQMNNLSNMQIRWKDTRIQKDSDIYIMSNVIDGNINAQSINASGSYQLKTGIPYKLGNGLWTVDDENMIYKGNSRFYVSTIREYIFKEQ